MSKFDIALHRDLSPTWYKNYQMKNKNLYSIILHSISMNIALLISEFVPEILWRLLSVKFNANVRQWKRKLCRNPQTFIAIDSNMIIPLTIGRKPLCRIQLDLTHYSRDTMAAFYRQQSKRIFLCILQWTLFVSKRLIDNTPLFEPMMVCFTDAYMRHSTWWVKQPTFAK